MFVDSIQASLFFDIPDFHKAISTTGYYFKTETHPLYFKN